MTDQQELDLLKQNRPDLVAACRALVREELHALFKVQRESFIRIVKTLEREYGQGKVEQSATQNSLT